MTNSSSKKMQYPEIRINAHEEIKEVSFHDLGSEMIFER